MTRRSRPSSIWTAIPPAPPFLGLSFEPSDRRRSPLSCSSPLRPLARDFETRGEADLVDLIRLFLYAGQHEALVLADGGTEPHATFVVSPAGAVVASVHPSSDSLGGHGGAQGPSFMLIYTYIYLYMGVCVCVCVITGCTIAALNDGRTAPWSPVRSRTTHTHPMQVM